MTVLGVRPVITKKAKDKPAKAEKAEKAEKASKAEKADKPAKAEEIKKEKAIHEVTKLGSRIGSQAEKIDIAMLAAKKPFTYKDLADKTGYTVARIKVHVMHLIGKKGMKLDNGDGTFSIK